MIGLVCFCPAGTPLEPVRGTGQKTNNPCPVGAKKINKKPAPIAKFRPDLARGTALIEKVYFRWDSCVICLG